MSRCDFPANSSSDLPHSWRHSGFLHGPGTNTWDGCAGIHRSESSSLFHICDFSSVSMCVLHLALGRWWWTAAAGSSLLHCILSFSRSKHTCTPTHTNTKAHKKTNNKKKLFMGLVLFFQNATIFLCWITLTFLFVSVFTANWTTCSTCLLVPWVSAVSLRLCQWLRNSRAIQWHEGSWYSLCKFKRLFWVTVGV